MSATTRAPSGARNNHTYGRCRTTLTVRATASMKAIASRQAFSPASRLGLEDQSSNVNIPVLRAVVAAEESLCKLQEEGSGL